jgi:hypothetical protein
MARRCSLLMTLEALVEGVDLHESVKYDGGMIGIAI